LKLSEFGKWTQLRHACDSTILDASMRANTGLQPAVGRKKDGKTLEMKKKTPAWAMRRAKAEDYGAVRDSHSRGTMQIKWPDLKMLRDWARHQAWPTPRFGFEAAFLAQMFESRMSFERAINESGIEIHIPQPEYTISAARLRELDALYEERSPSGQPLRWGMLVEELRAIRRAVEAGVVVQVEGGPRMRTWQGFYGWAHGRYHSLEDGYDHWIGDDHP
jgi:hypothetical protein